MKTPAVAVAVALMVGACGSTGPSIRNESPPSPPSEPSEKKEKDPAEWVRALATSKKPLHRLVDWEFNDRLWGTLGGELPSRKTRAAVLSRALGSVPKHCRPILNKDKGYTAVAIPPPTVDQTEEQAAKTRRVIAGLREGTEIMALCKVTEKRQECDEDGCQTFTDRLDKAFFVLNVRRQGDGQWQIRAWRYLGPNPVRLPR